MPFPHSLHAETLTASKRIAVIAGKLVKYGFGSLLGQLGLCRLPWNYLRTCSLNKVFCRDVPFAWLPSVRDRCACYLDQGACPLPRTAEN